MRVLIFGVNGMLGHKLYQQFARRFDVYGTIRGEFESLEAFDIFHRENILTRVDAFEPNTVKKAIETAAPDCVINAVGIIKQRPTSKDVIQTLSLNSIFPHRLAEFSSHYGFRLITISTDCVFSGAKGNYSESDIPDARDLYGLSKLLGELSSGNVLSIRSSIIGRELAHGKSLAEWFLSNRGGRVEGYTNAIYSGFPTIVMADILADIIERHPDLSGVWHISSDPISKRDLLELLNKYYRTNTEIVPSDAVMPDRSLDSSRFRQAAAFEPQDWETMISRMAADPTPYGEWARGNAVS